MVKYGPQLPSNFEHLNLEIQNELKDLNKEILPISFQKKCIRFVISVLDYLLENFEKIDLYEYLDYLGSYYLQFTRDSKGKETPGLTLCSDMDPITDVFLEISSLEEPYKKEDIQRIIILFKKYLKEN